MTTATMHRPCSRLAAANLVRLGSITHAGRLRPLPGPLSTRSAGPDQVPGAVLARDQGGVDRSREARIVELDRVVGPTLLRGPLPRGAELDVGAGDDAVVRGLVAVLLQGPNRTLALRVRVLTEPVRPLPFWVKVPMIALTALR